MADVPEVKVSVYSHPGVSGRPQNDAAARRQIALARHHGRRALLLSIRRLTAYLSNPATPIDATYISAFRELASRCGLPAISGQTVDQRSLNMSLSAEDTLDLARQLLREVVTAEAAEERS